MKIVSSGRVLNSAAFYKKKKRRKRLQFILIFIGVLEIIFSLIYFFRQEQFLITTIVVTGENVIAKEEITQTVRHLLDGYYLWIIPRANTFIYPRQTIEQNLTEAFPRLKSIDLNVDELRTLILTVEERAPFALYCVGDKCFFLDKEGLIFAPAPSFSAGVYFIYRTEDLIENPIGKRFVTPEEFGSLLKFMETLSILNIRPSTLEIGIDDYSLFLSDGGRIIWRRGDDLLFIRSNLEAFLSDDSIRAQSDFLKKILYLDLRTENKVFYKFK